MKNIRIFTLLFFLGILSISCEKCYECQRPNLDMDGNFLGDYSTSNICAPPAQAKLLKEEEEHHGYTCREQ